MEELYKQGIIHNSGVLLWFSLMAIMSVELIRDLKKNEINLQGKGSGNFLMILINLILVGSTGVFLISEWEVWSRISNMDFWWVQTMIMAWILFSIVFFLLDPLVLRDHDGQ